MREPWRAIKAILLQVHSIAGLVLALLLALIALTGAIMSFEDEIVDHLNAGIMQVAPRTTPALMPDELVAIASAEYIVLCGSPRARSSDATLSSSSCPDVALIIA